MQEKGTGESSNKGETKRSSKLEKKGEFSTSKDNQRHVWVLSRNKTTVLVGYSLNKI